MKYRKPELVSPAGNWSSLKSAVASGADAVYFGIKGLNMRSSAENFDILEAGKVMDFLRANNKKGYLVLNVIVFQHELEKVRRILEAAKDSMVDAVILWDLAVMTLAREMGLDVHLSTQASVSNFESLKMYASMGVKRAVLARECSLDDISVIRSLAEEHDLGCGIETFIHGAMCVSVSGRCFLSQYSFNSSANRGECLQPCRREFLIKDPEDKCEYILGEDYVLSPRDLCTLPIIDSLIEKGIDAFKIEGRMRPAEYVSVVTSVYRRAIDAFMEGKFDDSVKRGLFAELKQSFNRGFSSGFYMGVPLDTGDLFEREYEKIYLGEVVKFYKKIGVAEILVTNNGLKRGDRILITGKKTPAVFTDVREIQIDHEPVDSVCKGTAAGIKVPLKVSKNDKVFLWKEKG